MQKDFCNSIGHQRPNEAIDFESALTSTPGITLHRTERRDGTTTDSRALQNKIKRTNHRGLKGMRVLWERSYRMQCAVPGQDDTINSLNFVFIRVL